MATVKKQGSGYKITVSMGYDIHGKQIRQHMTWTPSPGMTPKQVEKELKRQEVLFEERCKSRQITGGSLKLADFAQLWLVLQKKLCKNRQAIVKETEANQGFAGTGLSSA